MAVAKFVEMGGDIAAQMLLFRGARVYIGAGAYDDRAAMVAAVGSDLPALLGSDYDELGEVAEKPGKISGSVDLIKLKNKSIPGLRKNAVELNLVGISEGRLAFLESELSEQEATIIIVNSAGDTAMVFNGLTWTGSQEGEIGDVFKVTLKAEFEGVTANKIWILEGQA